MNITIRDVARVADVSIATVSHVVNNSRNVKAATRFRVERAIEQTGYRHNAVARELKTGLSGLIGVLIVDYNTFYTDVLRGIEDSVGSVGWKFVIASTGEQWERQKELIQVMVARRMQGILIAPVEGFDAAYVLDYVPENIPVVLFDRTAKLALPSVSSQNREGAQLVVEHLHNHGYQRVLLVLSKDEISTMQDRKEGFLETANRVGMQASVIETTPTPEGGRLALEQTFCSLNARDYPQAVVAGNNPLLLGVLKCMREREMAIGQTIAVASFDDLPWCEVYNPPITVVHQSSYGMGRKAVQMMSDLLEGQEVESQQLKMELIIRGSCGCQF